MAAPRTMFSDDYRQARRLFLESAEAANAQVESHVLPGRTAPDGAPLVMDIATLGPAHADVVVLSLSGTHGVEGFCGSAAQACWLRDGAGLPPGVRAILVHAVNPFGFAHMVRCNEANVDLNRNFVDFTNPLPSNPLYEALDARLPTRLGVDEDLVEEWTAVYEDFWREHGDWAASDAASRGQYTRPDGVQFGGQAPQWSSSVLAARVKALCAGARHVAYIDWHSLVRLGDGELVFLCFNQTGDRLFRRVGDWWGAGAISRETVNAQWGKGWTRSERRPSRNGLVMWGLQRALAPDADLAGAVIEFCADPDRLHSGLRAGIRIRLYERWLLETRGYDTPTGRALVARLREATSPTRRGFEERALDCAMETYARTLAGAAAWALEKTPAAPGALVFSSGFD